LRGSEFFGIANSVDGVDSVGWHVSKARLKRLGD
jgi:hypothetical protein